MTEELWGVVIGAAIGLAGSLIAQSLGWLKDYRLWKRDNRLQHLREKRSRRESVYKDIVTMHEKLTRLRRDMEEGRLSESSDSVTFSELFFVDTVPQEVRRYQVEFMEDGRAMDGSDWAKLMSAMKNDLQKVDDEIEKLLK